MKTSARSVERIIEEQVQRWQIATSRKPEEQVAPPIVTLSREPGSGGRVVAQKLSEKLGYDLFHQEMIHEMAKSAKVSERVLTTLDEKGLNTLENWISSLVDDHHLWPDEYLQHLMKVVGTIGRHGKAIMVGRGANFILPPGKRFRVRIIAPRPLRIKNVAETFSVSPEMAKKRIIQTESDRKSFVRKYFHTDIADPLNYDMILNTETFDLDSAAESICSALKMKC
jgi:cytidylate kinase